MSSYERLNQEDKKKIKDTILMVEKNTHGEILPLLVEQSDIYLAAHIRLQLILALLFGFLTILFFPHLEHPIYYLYAQLPGVIIGHFLAYHPLLKRWLTTSQERQTEVRQRAQEAFFTHRLYATQNHTGILIMLSLLEKKIEILVDSGISSKIPHGTWVQLVQNLSLSIKKGELAEGLCKVIRSCGDLLAENFPLSEMEKSLKKNELSNDIIIE